MKRFLIIADDFTGANDSGVQLKRNGISTQVVFKSEYINNDRISYVIDTESREMTPEAAYETVKKLVSAVDISSFDYVIKKVDSTLRGNIPYEVKAVDEILNPAKILFAPAFPDIGRITKGGRHYLNDVPIIETEFARDPLMPVETDYLDKLISKTYDDDSRICCPDCITNAELVKIAAEFAEDSKSTLWVGSAGICDAILSYEYRQKPAAALITSVSETTRNQVKYAESKGIKIIKVPIQELLINRDSSYAETAIKYLSDGEDILLISSATYDRHELKQCIEAGAKYGYDRFKLSALTQEIMSEMMDEILSKSDICGLFLSGGDTAVGFLKKAEADGSEILGELANGIPVMKLTGGRYDGMKVITKAGGFGNEDTIAAAFRKLKEKNFL